MFVQVHHLQRRCKSLHLDELCLQYLRLSRCSNQAHEADILYASVLEHLDSGYGALAGGQHRIDDNEASVFNIWQLAVVFYRF